MSNSSRGQLRGHIEPRLSDAKILMRKALDRVAQPYIDQTVQRVAATATPTIVQPSQPAFTETHAALHEARSIALAAMPSGAETVLSAGANGLWYFEWFDAEYGTVPRHIGVEAYLPRPDDLPPNVEWISADLAGPVEPSLPDLGRARHCRNE